MSRLFRKFFLTFLVALMTFFFAGIFYLTLLSHSHQDEETHLRADVMLSTAATLLTNHNTAALSLLLQHWNAQPSGPLLAIIDAQGQALTGSATTLLHQPQAYRQILAHYTLLSSVSPSHAISRPPFLLPLITGVLTSVIFSFFLAWYLSKPVLHLRQAFTKVGRGQWNTRVSHHIGSRRDEIADLGHEFDHMADQIQQLIGAQQRLLHDLSHELRSPLARLQVAIGLLRQQPEEQSTALTRIEHEVERLDNMLQEVLTLARLESGAATPRRERLDIMELLAAIADDAAFEAKARHCQVILHAEGRFVVDVHGELIYRALENVIRNAVKFTTTATAVEICAEISADAQVLDISVRDHGIGVPVHMLEAIFEPFRQVDGQTEGGYGLGLAIARRAIESHGGSIVAEQAAGGGLTMRIQLLNTL